MAVGWPPAEPSRNHLEAARRLWLRQHAALRDTILHLGKMRAFALTASMRLSAAMCRKSLGETRHWVLVTRVLCRVQH